VVILHTFLTLLAGFLTIAALVAGFDALLKRVIPGGANAKNQPAAMLANLCSTLLATAAGGYVTIWAAWAQGNPLVEVLVLAIVVLAISALSALQSRGLQPVWYQLTMVALAPLGVLAGAVIKLKIGGIL
jgi:hypothetical protein